MKNFFNSTNADSQSVKAMDSNQFDRVVKAIIEGRYSWACVLILRFAGYNPAHYIPYRTYKRLIKDNKQVEPIVPDKAIKIQENRDPSREDRISSSPKMYL